jgi:hypothetical protein
VTSTRPRLAAASSAVALLAALGLSACGSSGSGKPSTAAIASKLAGDSQADVASAGHAALDCLAAVLLKYEPAADLNNYVAGKESFSDLPDPKDTASAQTDINACGKLAE